MFSTLFQAASKFEPSPDLNYLELASIYLLHKVELAPEMGGVRTLSHT
jgi:hypothetical protein